MLHARFRQLGGEPCLSSNAALVKGKEENTTVLVRGPPRTFFCFLCPAASGEAAAEGAGSSEVEAACFLFTPGLGNTTSFLGVDEPLGEPPQKRNA